MVDSKQKTPHKPGKKESELRARVARRFARHQEDGLMRQLEELSLNILLRRLRGRHGR